MLSINCLSKLTYMSYFFFFSSRRRHTRWPRDWSSDVCSSDLGWLYPLTQNEKGRQAFDPYGWNKYRVEAIGPSIRIWINGVNTSNLLDDMTLEGIIGLQVHSIRQEEQQGKEIRWRNIRIATENIDRYRWEMDPEVVEDRKSVVQG